MNALTVVSVTVDEARALTDQIRQALVVVTDLVVEAFTSGAWSALGYGSWQAYCNAEFTGGMRWARSIPVPQRREITQTMTGAGMSTRAIGAALGVDHATVLNDRRGSGGGNSPPDNVVGLDGKRYRPPATRAAVAARWDQVRELAETGMTSAQIAREVGIGVEGLRSGAKRRGIVVHADTVLRKRASRLDPAIVFPRAVDTLDQLAELLALTVETTHIEPDQATTWAAEIARATRHVQTAVKSLRESK